MCAVGRDDVLRAVEGHDALKNTIVAPSSQVPRWPTAIAYSSTNMPLRETIGDDTTSGPAKATFEKLHAKLKMVSNIFRTLAKSPLSNPYCV